MQRTRLGITLKTILCVFSLMIPWEAAYAQDPLVCASAPTGVVGRFTIGTSDFTLDFWVRMPHQADNSTLPLDFQNVLRLTNACNDPGTSSYELSTGPWSLGTIVPYDAGGRTVVSAGGTGRIDDGLWHHIVIIANRRIYTDGISVPLPIERRANLISAELSVANPSCVLSQGNSNYRLTAFSGEIRDLVLYDRALTESEIDDTFQYTGPARCTTELQRPTNLRATQFGLNGTAIKLAWDYGNDPIEGFKIERKTPTGDWVELPTRPSGAARAFVDTSITPYATYSYRMRAYNNSDDSEYSERDTCFQLLLGSAQCVLIQAGQEQCSSVVPLGSGVGGNKIVAAFRPEPTVTLDRVAQALGYDHFNWTSIVNHNDARTWYDIAGNRLSVPFLDPPFGGYGQPSLLPSDSLPYFWDEPEEVFAEDAGGDPRTSVVSIFQDLPYEPLLSGGDLIGFLTTLVGVRSGIGDVVPDYTGLINFSWSTTYNGSDGVGVGRLSNLEPPATTGTGGIFAAQIVEPEDLPDTIRNTLVQAGAKGIPTIPRVDKDAPMTGGFAGGVQGTNSWYRSSVTVSLIATDISGPSAIAGTSYTVDGESTLSYAGPFTVAGDGQHSIEFASIDVSGNTEEARSLIFRIDATPPSILGNRSPLPNTNNWNNSAVAVRFQCSDAVSGLAPGSPPAPAVISSQGAGQSVAGTCTDLAGNSVSATVSDINLDLAPPTLSIPAPLALNATSPAGATVIYPVSASDVLDPRPTHTCTPTSGAIMPIGDTTVNCTATDRAGNANAGVFTVHVKGAAEQLNELWLGVINDSRLPAHVKAALSGRIQEALARLDPSNPRERKLACASMSVFIAVVRIYSGRTIPKTRADALIADALRIRAVLGC